MAKRTSLSALTGMIEAKGAPAPAPIPAKSATGGKGKGSYTNSGTARKQAPAVLFRLDYEARKIFKIAATEADLTIQDALLEALNDWLEKQGKGRAATYTPEDWRR